MTHFLDNILYSFNQKKYILSLKAKKKIHCGKKVSVSSCVFEGHNYLGDNVDIGWSYVGAYSYVCKDSLVSFSHIGRYCSISRNVKMIKGCHPISELPSSSPFFYNTHYLGFVSPFKKREFIEKSKEQFNIDGKIYEIVIGNDVWIGMNAIILPGVKIGDGAIIGAGSVVTHDVEPYAIMAGVPAKLIRFRFDKHTISTLLQQQWWNLDPNFIDAFFDEVKLHDK